MFDEDSKENPKNNRIGEFNLQIKKSKDRFMIKSETHDITSAEVLVIVESWTKRVRENLDKLYFGDA